MPMEIPTGWGQQHKTQGISECYACGTANDCARLCLQSPRCAEEQQAVSPNTLVWPQTVPRTTRLIIGRRLAESEPNSMEFVF